MSENYEPSLEGTPFNNGDQIGLHEASPYVESYDAFAARRDAEAAYAQPADPEVAPVITPEQCIGLIGTNLAVVRGDYIGMDPRDFELMTMATPPKPEGTKEDYALGA